MGFPLNIVNSLADAVVTGPLDTCTGSQVWDGAQKQCVDSTNTKVFGIGLKVAYGYLPDMGKKSGAPDFDTVAASQLGFSFSAGKVGTGLFYAGDLTVAPRWTHKLLNSDSSKSKPQYDSEMVVRDRQTMWTLGAEGSIGYLFKLSDNGIGLGPVVTGSAKYGFASEIDDGGYSEDETTQGRHGAWEVGVGGGAGLTIPMSDDTNIIVDFGYERVFNFVTKSGSHDNTSYPELDIFKLSVRVLWGVK